MLSREALSHPTAGSICHPAHLLGHRCPLKIHYGFAPDPVLATPTSFTECRFWTPALHRLTLVPTTYSSSLPCFGKFHLCVVPHVHLPRPLHGSSASEAAYCTEPLSIILDLNPCLLNTSCVMEESCLFLCFQRNYPLTNVQCIWF